MRDPEGGSEPLMRENDKRSEHPRTRVFVWAPPEDFKSFRWGRQKGSAACGWMPWMGRDGYGNAEDPSCLRVDVLMSALGRRRET